MRVPFAAKPSCGRVLVSRSKAARIPLAGAVPGGYFGLLALFVVKPMGGGHFPLGVKHDHHHFTAFQAKTRERVCRHYGNRKRYDRCDSGYQRAVAIRFKKIELSKQQRMRCKHCILCPTGNRAAEKFGFWFTAVRNVQQYGSSRKTSRIVSNSEHTICPVMRRFLYRLPVNKQPVYSHPLPP